MLNKALAIKDAIISTSQGIVKALALGPIGIPLAAIIGAMGAVQIATIAQQQYTGRARGGNVDKNTPYMVGERGAEMFVPQQRGTIISAESMRNMSRGGDVAPVNVTFQIQANDTTGFDDLITSRRGLIINLINTALNERGKEGITS
jgi:SLT domain-containing protein